MLKTDIHSGLSSAEAKKRLSDNAAEKKNTGEFYEILRHTLVYLKDPVSLALMCMALVSIVVAVNISGNWVDPVMVLVLCPVRALVCAFSKRRSVITLEKVKELSKPTANVFRDGDLREIPAEELVVGDIIYLRAGDVLPADGRLFEADALVCDESSLEDGNANSHKDAFVKLDVTVPLAERANLIFEGCSVTLGSGKAIVTAVGISTEAGKTARLLSSNANRESPLLSEMRLTGRNAGVVLFIGCALLFFISIISKRADLNSIAVITTLTALCVCANPWGLEDIADSALAEGAGRLTQSGIITTKSDAVERLATVSVICSDKTGALTLNRMELSKIWANGSLHSVQEGRAGKGTMRLLEYATLCCDANAEKLDDGSEHRSGDATEAAIVSALLAQGEKKSHLDLKYPRIAVLPFDRERRLKTSVHRIGGKLISITKGAPEALLPLCSDEGAQKAWEVCEKMSSDALRVLAVGFRELKEMPEELNAETLESKLTLIGLIGVQDIIRDDVFASVKKCSEAGIRVVMTTGDHKYAALATAKSCGIIKNGDESISGAELAALSDDELDGNIRKYSVISRASHSDKLRIVEAWKRSGESIAVTGDASDDAAALAVADAGFSMDVADGSVAGNAAAFSLKNPSFSAVVEAVKQGRGIFANVRHCVQYSLSLALGLLLAFLLCLLIFAKMPFSASQLIVVFIISKLCSSALKFEPADSTVMQRAPFRTLNGYISPRRFIAIAGGAFLIASIVIGVYSIGSRTDIPTAQTMAFISLCIALITYSYSMRSDRSLFLTPPLSNPNLLFSCIFALIVTLGVVLGLSGLFGFAQLSLWNWVFAILFGISPIVFSEFAKFAALQSLKLLNTNDKNDF